MLGRFRKNGKDIPEEDPSSIGNLAIERGYITEAELRAAVRVQQSRLPLGQILVDMGKLTSQQLEDLLFEQRVRRGEIKDKGEIARYERSRLRRKMGEIRDGFRELSADSKQLSVAFLDTTSMRVRTK